MTRNHWRSLFEVGQFRGPTNYKKVACSCGIRNFFLWSLPSTTHFLHSFFNAHNLPFVCMYCAKSTRHVRVASRWRHCIGFFTCRDHDGGPQRFREHKDVTGLLARTSAIRSTVLNLNASSERHGLRDFQFKKCDLGRILDIVAWSEVLSHNKYSWNHITAICFTLKRLATTVRWVDRKRAFGMDASQMSEIYWESVSKYVKSYGYIFNMRGGFLK